MSQVKQDFMIPLAEIARDGNWETVMPPYMCEEDMITEDEMDMFDRLLHFKIDSDRKEELGLNRTKEGSGSVEAYELVLHCPTLADIRAVKKQLRNIFIQHDGSIYGWISMPVTAFRKEYGRWGQLIAVTANLAGKYFG